MSVPKQVRPSRLLVLSIPLMAVVVVVLAWGQAAPQSAQAEETGPQMALSVAGAGASCDAASEPTECWLPAGGDFTLAVEVIEAPEPSYIGVQSYVVYDGLTYNPTASAEDEFAWPDADGLIVRFPGEPTGTEGTVKHGAATANTPPFPESTHEGGLLELSFTCPADTQSFEVALIPYSDDVTVGAGFKVDAMTTATLKTVGQREVDLDGDPATPPELMDVADTVAVNCGEAMPTATSEADGLPPTGDGAGVDAAGGVGAGLWSVIGALLAVAAAGLGIFAWRHARVR